MRLDQSCKMPIGSRDAVHVPIVVGRIYTEYAIQNKLYVVNPGTFVKFIDNSFKLFVPASFGDDYHGITNPFIDPASPYDDIVVLIKPGITTPVRHEFDIDFAKDAHENAMLQEILKEMQADDPTCAECWVISNKEVIRM